MPDTDRISLHYPIDADPATVPSDIYTLVNQLDDFTTVFEQGAIADRPDAGTPGRVFFATDLAQLFWDDGSNWKLAGGRIPPVFDLADPGFTPVEGDVIDFGFQPYTAYGIYWRLRYKADMGVGNDRHWLPIGAAPLTWTDTSLPIVSSSTFASGVDHALTIPTAGRYLVEFGTNDCQVNSGGDGAWAVRCRMSIRAWAGSGTLWNDVNACAASAIAIHTNGYWNGGAIAGKAIVTAPAAGQVDLMFACDDLHAAPTVQFWWTRATLTPLELVG